MNGKWLADDRLNEHLRVILVENAASGHFTYSTLGHFLIVEKKNHHGEIEARLELRPADVILLINWLAEHTADIDRLVNTPIDEDACLGLEPGTIERNKAREAPGE